jgi:D-alanine-D-alanine ligase
VVLYGGQSAEHEISCISARFVLSTLDPARYEVVLVGITRDGRWVDATRLVGGADPASPALPSPDLATAGDVLPAPGVGALAGAPGAPAETVAFAVLHGPMGEDGTIQGMLEVAGIPYVGAGVLASAVSMDKSVAKELLHFAGIPQARWRWARADEIDEDLLDGVELNLGYPVYVKPANLGSSIGITRAADRAALERGVALACGYDDFVVFEENVVGREIEVAVLGNEEPRASLPGEIVAGEDFYDFEEKYLSDRAKLLVPAPLSEPEVAEIQELALRAFRALRLDGMARVDFFCTEGGRFLVNEVNSIPGFTPISMYPRLWEASGLPPAELLDRLIDLALARHARRRAHRVDR